MVENPWVSALQVDLVAQRRVGPIPTAISDS
jgi:hypothetical protein